MKEETLKRVNKSIISYLSVVGLSDNKKNIDMNNPIFVYFTNLIYYSGKSNDFVEMMEKLNNPENLDNSTDIKGLLDLNKLPLIPVNIEMFHKIVQELYKVYKKVDNIKEKPNEEIKNILVSFVGGNNEYEKYISEIVNNYKQSLYELVRYYNSDKTDYNNIKIDVLYDKMMEFAEEEEYMEAAELKKKINDIKENRL